MLISSYFLTGILLLVHSVQCSDIQDGKSVNGKTFKQFQTETEPESYQYNHPPLPETSGLRRSRKESSIDVNERDNIASSTPRIKTIRRKISPKSTTTAESEIPVKIIYDAETTTTRSYRNPTTTSPVDKTTRIVIQRRRQEPSDSKKTIDIRQTTSNTNTATTNPEKLVASTEVQNSEAALSTEFPQRSRGSYFMKRVAPPTPRVKILEEQNFVYSHTGNFHYSFLGGDGTKVSSQGELKKFNNNTTGEAVSGNVFYTDKEGNDFSLSYTADENGYRPVGAHLPTPPPLPPAIARALKYIADKSTPAPKLKNEE